MQGVTLPEAFKVWPLLRSSYKASTAITYIALRGMRGLNTIHACNVWCAPESHILWHHADMNVLLFQTPRWWRTVATTVEATLLKSNGCWGDGLMHVRPIKVIFHPRRTDWMNLKYHFNYFPILPSTYFTVRLFLAPTCRFCSSWSEQKRQRRNDGSHDDHLEGEGWLLGSLGLVIRWKKDRQKHLSLVSPIGYFRETCS